MSPKTPKFKKLLRRWRCKRTQSEAAAILGINVATYRNWEYGRNEPPSYVLPEILKKIEAHGS